MKALVIGDALLDKYIYASLGRQSPEDPNCGIWDVSGEIVQAGGALNVAANLAQLIPTMPVRFAGILEQEWYDRLLAHKYGVYPTWMTVPTSKAIYKTRLMEESSGRQVLRIDNRASFSGTDIALFNGVVTLYADKLPLYKVIVVSDYCKGTISNEVIEALKKCPDSTIIVDTKRRDLALWSEIPNCIVKVNKKEFAEAHNTSSVNVIVTMGPEGSTYIPKKGTPYMVMGEEAAVSCAGVIGAGDAYLAGFAAHYAEHLDVKEAMSYADYTARSYVRTPGTNVVTHIDVLREKERDRDNQRRTWRHCREG